MDAGVMASLRSGTRVFAVESEADTTVSPRAVNKFMAYFPAPQNGYVWYPAAAGIAHSKITRPETNPLFNELEYRLREFAAE